MKTCANIIINTFFFLRICYLNKLRFHKKKPQRQTEPSRKSKITLRSRYPKETEIPNTEAFMRHKLCLLLKK